MISIYSDNHMACINTHILHGKMQFFTIIPLTNQEGRQPKQCVRCQASAIV